MAAALLALSLGVGMLGYGHFEGLPWIDGFLNSAMLLGGMGPVNPPLTAAGKLFAGIYALYAGLVFIVGRTRRHADPAPGAASLSPEREGLRPSPPG